MSESDASATEYRHPKGFLTARDVIVPDGEQDDFESFRQELAAELAPQGAVETLVFNELLHAAWNLERFRRAEHELFVNGADPVLSESAADTAGRLSHYPIRAQNAYYRALQELRILQTDRASRLKNARSKPAVKLPALVSMDEYLERSPDERTAEALTRAAELVSDPGPKHFLPHNVYGGR